MLYQAIVFDLFHTLVDPEDFRPKEFRRVERAAELLGVRPDHFSAFWQRTASLRNRSRAKANVQFLREYLADLGLPPPDSALAQADHALGHYQDLAIINPRPQVELVLRALVGNWAFSASPTNARYAPGRTRPLPDISRPPAFLATSVT